MDISAVYIKKLDDYRKLVSPETSSIITYSLLEEL